MYSKMLKANYEDLNNESKRFSELSLEEQAHEKVNLAKLKEDPDYRQEVKRIN